jgi:hypothetical protein
MMKEKHLISHRKMMARTRKKTLKIKKKMMRKKEKLKHLRNYLKMLPPIKKKQKQTTNQTVMQSTLFSKKPKKLTLKLRIKA